MPVPNSIDVVDDSEWTAAPHVPFKSKKTFDHSGNILNMLRDGGSLRGLLSENGVGCFEVMSKRELREENGDVKIGHGRRVPSYTVKRMIALKEIYIQPRDDSTTSDIACATATVDEFYADDFPADWGVLDKPYLDSSLLFKEVEGVMIEVCNRPRGLRTDQWLPIARAMAIGAQSFDLANAVA
jgi:hypothetical protein